VFPNSTSHFLLGANVHPPKEKPQARLEKVDGGCEQTSEGGRDEAGKAGSNGKCSENNKNNQASRFPSYSTLVLGSVEDPGFLK